MSNYVCIIPARKNSIRLKNKNFKLFNKKKMIEHTIIAAKKTKLFKKIVLSSDSDQILNLSKKYSVSSFKRDKYSDNLSSIASATIYTIKKMNLYRYYDNVVQLMPTCPYRNASDIIKSIRNFEKNKIKFQISCFKLGLIHFNWALIKKKKKLNFFFKKKKQIDNSNIFYPSGAVWIANIKELILKKDFYNKNTKYFELNWLNSIDIDTIDDFENAVKLSKAIK